MDLKWNDALYNRSQAEALIRNAGKSDLYVLPEMFTTGFITNPANGCEQEEPSSARLRAESEENGETLEWMKRMAASTGAAITGSVAVNTTAGDFRNRMYFVKPDENYTYYDKRHLFTYAGEHLSYTAGTEPIIVTWQGVRVMLQVCYDLRFPCFSRNRLSTDVPLSQSVIGRAESTTLAKQEEASPTLRAAYDLIIYIASWPQSRRSVWDILLRARAIENQCYVVGVNRTGDDPNCHYNGGTIIIDPYGRVTATAPDDETTTVTASVDMDGLRKFREKFPVLRDAD